MICYDYHPETLEHTGSHEAYIDPVATEKTGKDVYALPAHATWEKPPTVPEGHVAIFKEGKWSTVEDHRGTAYWIDGQRHEMTDLGSLPTGASLTEPVKPQPTLDETKELKRKELWDAGDAIVAAIDAQAVSVSDKENATAHQKGIEDLQAGRQSVCALGVTLAAKRAGRTVEDLIKAHEQHTALGVLIRSLVSGEQNRLTAEMRTKTTIAEVQAVVWTMTAEAALSTARTELAAVAAQ